MNIKVVLLIMMMAGFLGIEKQGQNAQPAQNKTNASASGQPTVNYADPKPTRDANKNQSQPVSITSVPKIAVKPDEDWVMVVCTIVLTVVGIFGTCVAIKTLKAINLQAHYMHVHAKHFDKLAKATASQTELMNQQLIQMTTAGTHTQDLALQAVRQSDLTQRQLDLANRPWISIEFIRAASNLEFRDSGDVLIWFSYQIRNVGHSVAQHIAPWIEPIIMGVGDPAEVRTRISNQMKRPIDSPFDHGKLIFPNQVITDRYLLMIRPNDLVNALDKSPFKDRDEGTIRAIGLEIFVCFDYQSTLDLNKHYQTQSMYLLSYRGNGMFLQSQKSYGMDGMGLVFKGFGAYAD